MKIHLESLKQAVNAGNIKPVCEILVSMGQAIMAGETVMVLSNTQQDQTLWLHDFNSYERWLRQHFETVLRA